MKARAYTVEEVKKQFLDHAHAMVEYWNNLDEGNQRDRLDGLAFSIMSMLDGCAITIPGFAVVPQPHSTDKKFHQERGENWYPETKELKHDIAGTLHEEWHRRDKPNG